jgi:hypothetical protein
VTRWDGGPTAVPLVLDLDLDLDLGRMAGTVTWKALGRGAAVRQPALSIQH